jgi:hypothetical protein
MQHSGGLRTDVQHLQAALHQRRLQLCVFCAAVCEARAWFVDRLRALASAQPHPVCSLLCDGKGTGVPLCVTSVCDHSIACELERVSVGTCDTPQLCPATHGVGGGAT